ncbi:relaxase/mobilization nuclease domain-containing protein [Nocardia farcinica]|uniref:relaxase/mobilization nuclease domain-containing protein n=1 Tax=Nocardia farcinica TaxID=37329 RepID=UPI002456A351|nr:hypothetical protein [Nocardia farcinica]
MIPNSTKGSDIKRLLWYLAGPGRYNEHVGQRVLAGDAVTMAVFAGRINQARAWELGKLLDSPRQVLLRGDPVSVTSYQKARALMAEGMSRKAAFEAATSDENTWHCSLALHPDEGALSDEKWQAIATDFMREMGFVDAGDAVPDVRWAAVHHGPNRNGCDHIHIAMSVVRADGSLVDMMYDRPRSQRAAGRVERKHGLRVLASRETGETEAATTPAERAYMQRVGAHETDREALRRRVRAAAAATGSEAEWLRELRTQQIVVRPRFAKDSTEEVVGYSVRMPAQRNVETGVWETPRGYSGLQLGKDLTLPALRSWAGWETSETAQQEAAAEWRRLLAASDRRGARAGAHRPLDPAAQTEALAAVSRWCQRIQAIPAEDHAAVRRAASATAGLFAAASVSTEPAPGPMDRLSRQLARIGDTDPARRLPRRERADTASVRAAARLLWSTTSRQASQIALIEAMLDCFLAVAEARRAVGQAQAAEAMYSQARQALTEVHMRAAGINPDRPYESTPGSPAWVAAYRAHAHVTGEDPAITTNTILNQKALHATNTNRRVQKPMTPSRPRPWLPIEDERAARDRQAAEAATLQRLATPRRTSTRSTKAPVTPPRPARGNNRDTGFER